MKIEDVRTKAERRTFASAVAMIVALALVSLALECWSGSDLGEIAYSFASFGIILSVAVVRFFVRSSEPEPRERLWITALWNAAVDLMARLVPGKPAAPPAPPARAAGESSRPVTPPHRSPEDDAVRRSAHD